MSAICGVCNKDGGEIKCCICEVRFHVNCIKDDVKGTKTRSYKDFKCKTCREQNVPEVSAESDLKEFITKSLDDYKKHLLSELALFKTEMIEMTNLVQFISDKIDKTNLLMEKISNEMSEVRKEIQEVRVKNASLTTEVNELKERLRNLEQYSRRSNIELSGIPETQNENVLQIVKDVGAALGLEVDESQVSAAHRIPAYNKERNPSLIVQFQKKIVKDEWVNKYKENKSFSAKQINPAFPDQRVYLNDHLSPENKLFLKALKNKCKDIGYTYAWCRDGKFFARKSAGDRCLKISSMADIERLK